MRAAPPSRPVDDDHDEVAEHDDDEGERAHRVDDPITLRRRVLGDATDRRQQR